MDSFLNATTEVPVLAEGAHSFFSSVLEKMEHFPIKISFIFGLSIILGSVVPYIPQYITIHQTQNTEGFSLYVCLTLLVANILRIIFWFGNQYETPLLIQSIVMIAAMFALLELCVRVRNSNYLLSRRKNYFTDFDWRYFWEWTDFISYIECMAAFTFIAACLMYMFSTYKYVVESFGFAALVTESLLASPQFYRNFKSKSTEGMSRIMVATWFIGDLYKTIYFISRDTPVQFWMCGFIQITFDLLIFLQLFLYRKSNYKKLSKTRTNVAGKEERNLLHNEIGLGGSRKNSKLSQSQSQSPILDEGSLEDDQVEMNPVTDKTTSSNAFVNSDFDIVTEFRMQSDSSGSD